jgi:hypothetical protein
MSNALISVHSRSPIPLIFQFRTLKTLITSLMIADHSALSRVIPARKVKAERTVGRPD